MSERGRARVGRWRWWVLAVVVALCAGGMWLNWYLHPNPWEESHLGSDFDEAVFSAYDSGESVLLSDLTGFEWQTVSVFEYGASHEEVKAETGRDLVRGEYYTFSEVLLVFCGDHRVIDVHAYPFSGSTIHEGTYTSSALLQHGDLDEPSDLVAHAACT